MQGGNVITMPVPWSQRALHLLRLIAEAEPMSIELVGLQEQARRLADAYRGKDVAMERMGR